MAELRAERAGAGSDYENPNRSMEVTNVPSGHDVLLTIVNFVDRHTYRFEEDVLPIAQRHNIGIVATKVFGGARKNSGGYANPQSPPELDEKHLELALRYSLSTPGVCTLNIGKSLASKWGAHFGPVKEAV